MKILFFLIIVFLIYQIIELNRFTVKKIQLTDKNINHGAHFVFLSDIHGHMYGRHSRLAKKIKKLQPEGIIIGGDLISKQRWEQCQTMICLLQQLQEISPVYYVFGNHECSMEQFDKAQFDSYIEKLQSFGVQIIRNQIFYPFADKSISCYGMELPLALYKKGVRTDFPIELIQQMNLQWKEEEKTKLLFVHQPSFGDDYTKLNVKGIFSGHTHGGLVRIPGIGSLMNPELIWWPKYDSGVYEIGERKDTTLVVSNGLGTHHFHIRVFDSAQLIDVTLCPCKDEKN